MATLTAEPASATVRLKNSTGVLGLVGSAVAMIVVLLLPQPQGMPPEARRTAALFAGALVLWVTEALPVAVTALLVLVLQPILGLNTMATAGPRPAWPGGLRFG
jgi:di/tricarboxylate transporter